jgi:hypothetical protein
MENKGEGKRSPADKVQLHFVLNIIGKNKME